MRNDADTAAPRRWSGARVFLGAFVAVLLVELLWVAVVPALRGIDEFDHAYKADAVAHGQWTHDGAAPHGRGDLVRVTPGLVEVAGHPCRSRPYTEPDNCRAVARTGDLVQVASAAARYDPAYYVVVGTVGLPFQGLAKVVAMRVVTAVLCALLVAWAAVITARTSSSRWPLVALVVACTPVLVYSGSVVSPNGVGYAAALTLWAALLAAARSERLLAGPLAVSGTVLVVTHTTGVLWLGGTCLVAGCLLGARQTLRVLRHDLRAAAVVLGSWATATVLAVGWTLIEHTNALSQPSDEIPPLRLTALLRNEMLWVFQSIGAFPMRDESAPLTVYALWLPLFVVVVVTTLRGAERRTWLAILMLTVLWAGIPAVLTIPSYPSEGFAWQGRYALPLAVGFPAIAAWSLTRRGTRMPALAAAGVVAVCAVAHVVSVVGVARHEEGYAGPRLLSDSPTTIAVAALVVLAAAVLCRGVTPRPDPDVLAHTAGGELRTLAPSG